MALTAREIDELEFASAFRGYNPDEVDAALDRIALAFHRLERELEDMVEQQHTLLAERDELEQSLVTLQERAQQLERECDVLRAAPQGHDDEATVAQLREALEQVDKERAGLRKEVARLRRASDARWADGRSPQLTVATLPPDSDQQSDVPSPARPSHNATEHPPALLPPPPPPESSPGAREVSALPRPPHAW